MRMDSLRREAAKHPPTNDSIQISLQDLTLTVDRLSHRLEDFIETTSQHLSVSGSKHASRQVVASSLQLLLGTCVH